MFKTGDDPQVSALVLLIADRQLRLRAWHRPANDLGGSRLSLTATCARLFARVLVACAKPARQQGEAAQVAFDEQPTTYWPLLSGVQR